jgi:hypothetical protein
MGDDLRRASRLQRRRNTLLSVPREAVVAWYFGRLSLAGRQG